MLSIEQVKPLTEVDFNSLLKKSITGDLTATEDCVCYSCWRTIIKTDGFDDAAKEELYKAITENISLNMELFNGIRTKT